MPGESCSLRARALPTVTVLCAVVAYLALTATTSSARTTCSSVVCQAEHAYVSACATPSALAWRQEACGLMAAGLRNLRVTRPQSWAQVKDTRALAASSKLPCLAIKIGDAAPKSDCKYGSGIGPLLLFNQVAVQPSARPTFRSEGRQLQVPNSLLRAMQNRQKQIDRLNNARGQKQVQKDGGEKKPSKTKAAMIFCGAVGAIAAGVSLLARIVEDIITGNFSWKDLKDSMVDGVKACVAGVSFAVVKSRWKIEEPKL
jgi:hypothetical protein